MPRRSGESPAAIHLRLGHRSIQTTNRYIPQSPEKKQATQCCESAVSTGPSLRVTRRRVACRAF